MKHNVCVDGPSVPTIKNIQEHLIAMEDKEAGFLGSRDWIGSYEVFLVIDFLYNVSWYLWYLILDPCRTGWGP